MRAPKMAQKRRLSAGGANETRAGTDALGQVEEERDSYTMASRNNC